MHATRLVSSFSRALSTSASTAAKASTSSTATSSLFLVRIPFKHFLDTATKASFCKENLNLEDGHTFIASSVSGPSTSSSFSRARASRTSPLLAALAGQAEEGASILVRAPVPEEARRLVRTRFGGQASALDVDRATLQNVEASQDMHIHSNGPLFGEEFHSPGGDVRLAGPLYGL